MNGTQLIHNTSSDMHQGLFISFEGIDGAGKSSHIAAVADWFRSRGRVVTLTREPGGTPLSEQLRQLVLHQAMDPLSEALLMFAARREHLQQVICPALSRQEVVLSDRFTDATFAYQGYGRGFDLRVLETLEQWVQGDANTGTVLEPDMCFWFDLPAEMAAQRLAGARVPDKFEAQPADFFRQVALGYAARMQQSPKRFTRIHAEAAFDAVRAQVLACCEQHWNWS